MNTFHHNPASFEDINSHTQTESKIIVENFFDIAHLHEVKEMLREIKEQLIKKSYPHKKGSRQYSNTIYFFERLEQFIEAVYLLR